MHDYSPIAMGGASAAAYRCRSDSVAQVFVGHSCTHSFSGVHVGQVVYYILQKSYFISCPVTKEIVIIQAFFALRQQSKL